MVIIEVRLLESSFDKAGRSASVLLVDVPDQLVLPVISYIAFVAWVRFLLDVSSLVIVAISNCGKPSKAELALVRLFTSMNSHVDLEVATFVKDLATADALTLIVMIDNILTNKGSSRSPMPCS
jgi:hypothetical protein